MTLSPFHGIFSGYQQREKLLQKGQDDGASKNFPQQKKQKENDRLAGQVAVDIYEHEGYTIIKAPIAGVHLNDLDIEVSDNVLTIRGNREQTDTIPSDQYYLQECFWGEFSRRITLPFSIDPKRIRATFNKEGILKILVPKEEKIKIVRINES
jgi:HSP20 family protein